MIRVKRLQIPDLPTKAGRRLYVYVPRDYARSERRYPVLYMFDGHNVFYDRDATYGKSWGMKEYLEKTRLPLIVVAVECNPEGERRMNEYAPWDYFVGPLGHMEGLGKLTMDWICDTLKPEIDRRYRTLPDREHTLIAGSSMGGLMSLYALVEYNHVFSRAAALSPSLWAGAEHLPDFLESRELASPTQIYLDYGTGEIEDSFRDELSRGLFSTADALMRRGAAVDVRVVPGALHREADWEKRIPVFMDYLLG